MAELFTPLHLLVFVVFMAVPYFLPSIVAWRRKVEKRMGVQLLNLLLGWTVVGWVAALVWAAVGKTDAEARAAVFDYAKLAEAMSTRRDPPPH